MMDGVGGGRHRAAVAVVAAGHRPLHKSRWSSKRAALVHSLVRLQTIRQSHARDRPFPWVVENVGSRLGLQLHPDFDASIEAIITYGRRGRSQRRTRACQLMLIEFALLLQLLLLRQQRRRWQLSDETSSVGIRKNELGVRNSEDQVTVT
jgi:hypothetical protein